VLSVGDDLIVSVGLLSSVKVMDGVRVLVGVSETAGVQSSSTITSLDGSEKKTSGITMLIPTIAIIIMNTII